MTVASPADAALPGDVAGVGHFLIHQLARFRAAGPGAVVAGVANPLFFLLAVGMGLGSQIDGADLPTEDYLAFVGSGVVAAFAMTQGAGLSLWPTMAALKWDGTYDATLTTPLTVRALTVGHILWTGARAALMSALFVLVLVPFGIISSPAAVLAPLAAGLTSMTASAPLSAFAATRDTDASFSVIMRAGITPLFLFSGAFFPVDQLPDSIEWLVWFVPVWHGVELCRGLIVGGPILELAVHAVVQLLIVVVASAVAVRTFTRRLAA